MNQYELKIRTRGIGYMVAGIAMLVYGGLFVNSGINQYMVGALILIAVFLNLVGAFMVVKPQKKKQVYT